MNIICDILSIVLFFFFNDTATTEIYTLSLHDALPISGAAARDLYADVTNASVQATGDEDPVTILRSEEHTSELQSLAYLVCRLLLEKKKKSIKKTESDESENLCVTGCSIVVSEKT